MAAPMPLSDFEGLEREKWNICTIETTVVTGMESVAKEECQEIFATRVVTARGRLIFDIPIQDLYKVLNLRSVDNISVLIGEFGCFNFSNDKDADLRLIEQAAADLDWEKGLRVWKDANSETLQKSNGSFDHNGHDDGIRRTVSDDSPLRFRVTCNRAGQNHSFQSQEAAAFLGSGVIGKFGWKAKMTDFDVEVLLNICDNHLYVGLALTSASLHRRNIEHFGPTTLRSTIAHNMLRLANIQDNEVVCDPMCGGGSIPIEASISWPNAYHIAGDIHDLAWNRTKANLTALNVQRWNDNMSPLQLDVFQWNALSLPLRDECVDVFVTDLPFGKRCGSKVDNKTLYPKVLKEMARVGKPSTRVVMLTHDKRNMIRCLQMVSKQWKAVRTLNVNIGGLLAGVYLLTRNLKT